MYPIGLVIVALRSDGGDEGLTALGGNPRPDAETGKEMGGGGFGDLRGWDEEVVGLGGFEGRGWTVGI